MMAFSMTVGMVTLKMQRIDTGKYIHRYGSLGMADSKLLPLLVFLQVGYSKIPLGGTRVVQ